MAKSTRTLSNQDKKDIQDIVAKLTSEMASGKVNEDNETISQANTLAALKLIQSGLADLVGGSKQIKKMIDKDLKSFDFEKKVTSLFKTTTGSAKKVEKVFKSIADIYKGDIKALEEINDLLEDMEKTSEKFKKTIFSTTEAYDELLDLQTSMKDNYLKYVGSGEDGVKMLNDQIKKTADLSSITDKLIFNPSKYEDFIKELQKIQIEPNLDKVTLDGNDIIDPKKVMPKIKQITDYFNSSIDAEGKRYEAMFEDLAKDVIRNKKNLVLNETTNKVSEISTDSSGKSIFTDTQKATAAEMKSMTSDIADLLKQAGENAGLENGITEQSIKLLKTKWGIEDDMALIAANEIDHQKALLKAAKDNLQINVKLVETAKAYSIPLKKTDSIISNVADKISSMVGILPKGIVEFTGLDKLASSMRDNLDKANENFLKTMSEGKGLGTQLKAWGTYSKTLVGDFGKILTPTTLIIAGVAALVEITHEYQKALLDISETQGVSIDHASKLYDFNADLVASSKDLITTRAKALKIEEALVNTTGEVFDMASSGAADMIRSIDGVSEAFGIGTEEASKMAQAFQTIGADNSLSTDLSGYVALLSEAAGLSPQLVTKDLIDNADTLSMYFGGLPKQAAKAVIEIKKVGVSIDKAGALVQKTWNLDSFLTDMYELKAMSGIDLSKTFESGIAGDLEGTVKNTLDAIGTLDKLNQMSPQVLKKISDTTGLTNEELRKSLALREKGLSLTSEQAKLLQNMSYDDIIGKSKEEIKQSMEQLSLTAETNKEWDKLKSQLMVSILPLVKALGEAMVYIVPIIGKLGTLLGGMLTPLTFILDMIKDIGNAISSLWGGGTEDASHGMDEFHKSTEHANASIMETAFSLKGIGIAIGTYLTATKLLPGIWNNVSSIIGGIGNTFSVLKTGMKDLLSGGNVFGKIMEKISSPAKTIAEKVKNKGGDVIDKITGKSSPVKKGPSRAGEGIKTGLSNISSGIGKAITNISTSILNLVKNTFKAIGQAIADLSKGIGQAISNISSGLGTAIANLAKGLGSAIASISSGIGSGIASIGTGIGTAIEMMLTGISMGIASFAAAAIGLPVFAMAMGVISASVIALGFALKLAAPGIEAFGKLIVNVGSAVSQVVTAMADGAVKVISELGKQFKMITAINPLNLYALAGGVVALSGALVAMSASMAASSIGSFVSDLFGGGPLSKLENIDSIVAPVSAAASSINHLTESLTDLSQTLENLNLDSLSKLNNIKVDKIQQIQTTKKVEVSTPDREATGRNILVAPNSKVTGGSFGISEPEEKAKESNRASVLEDYMSNKQISTKALELLMKDMITKLDMYLSRPAVAILGPTEQDKMVRYTKGKNNN